MALVPRFSLTKLTIGLRACGFAAVPLFACFGSAAVGAQVPVAGDAPVTAGDVSEELHKEFGDNQYLDWVPFDQLTEAQKRTVPNSCCEGAYVPPVRTDSDVALAPEDAPFRSHADEQSSEAQSRMVFSGNVAVTQGNRSINADKLVYDRTTEQASLSGGIQVRDPNLMISAESGTLNIDTGDARFEKTRFVFYESRIHGVAGSLQKFGDNVVSLEQSLISSCEPGDKAWSVRGSEISIHGDEHYGTAKHMRINIRDVPVMYLPYVRFPVDDQRLTGFLMPTPAYSKRNGVELAVPFYWNIAPNADATFNSRYLSERGGMLETQVRHLSQYFETELNSSVISNDKGGFSSFLESEIANGNTTEALAYPYRGRDRWYAKLAQVGGAGQEWSSSINYTELSDRDYLRDMYNSSSDSNRQAFVRQMASADYRTEHWFSGIKVDEYRLLTTTQLPYRELPRIHLNGNYQANDWVLKLNNEYVKFGQNRYFQSSMTPAEYDASIVNILYGDRVNTDYSLTWDKSYPAGFVKPSLGLKGLTYALDTTYLAAGVGASPQFVVPQASLDSGLYFERDAGNDYLQTLEPRLFYFYSQHKNQDSLYRLTANNMSFVNFDTGDLTFNYNQLFRTTRFAGGDRIDDANQVSLALSTAFLSQRTGVERLRMSIGQIFYGQDRDIMIYDRSQLAADSIVLDESTRKRSDLAFQASGTINANLHASGDAAYDPRTGRLNSANSGLHYMDSAYRIFNLTYRYTLNPVLTSPSQPLPDEVQSMNQLDASIILPINSRWSIIARNNHDFTHNVELDTFAGLEYNDCCYRVRVMGRRWLRVDYTTPNFFDNLKSDDFEPTLMVELELKGLGSMDKQIGNLLDKTISGFRTREKTLR